MWKFVSRSLIGIVCLTWILGCQASPPQDGSGAPSESEPQEGQQAEGQTPIAEETFEAGDTGSLAAPEGEGEGDGERPQDEPREP